MERKEVRSVRDYVKNLSQARLVLGWIKREVVSKESAGQLKKMVAFMTVSIVFMLAIPLAVAFMFDGLSSHNRRLVIGGIVSVAICVLVQRFLEQKMAKLREYILGEHWKNLDNRLTELFFEKSPGQIIQESALSVSTIDKGRWKLLAVQEQLFFRGVHVVIQLSVSLVFLSILSWLSGILMLASMLIYIGYSVYLNFHVVKVCVPIDKSFRRLNRRRIERLDKAIRVQISSQSEREVSEMGKWFQETIVEDRKFWFWFIEQCTKRNLMNVFLLVAILSYGAYSVWQGEWQIGMLVPLYFWTSRVTENIWEIGHIEHQINWNLPSVISMIEALSLEPDVKNSSSPRHPESEPASVVFSEVCHSYPACEAIDDSDEDEDATSKPEETENHTLKKVSFSVEAGEKVALLGSTGAGKTTVMRLLLRFMDPTSGCISVGGTNLRDVSIESWRKCVGYIPQHPEVFDGTLRENLTYRLTPEERNSLKDEDLWKLMRMLEIDFGKRLTDGLDTKVGKHGLKLSGGQAQRLMIGAAVIGRPWLMVIDEATSHLDSTTEKKVQEGLAKILTGNTSALIVAHRLSTVRQMCTKFVVLKPSECVQNGDSQVEAIASSFEELYRISPTFRQLADDQGIKIMWS